MRLNVEDKTSKWIKLESNTIGEVASGYLIGNVTLDQTNIEVTGPKSAISQVDHAGVDINVTDSTSSLSANVDIKLYDADDNELTLESVKKNVNSAHMTVEVLATKEVPVEIEYMGVPEDGYMATGEVESSVPTVRIAGTASALVGISAITVPEDRMNITGQSSDLVDIINLKEISAVQCPTGEQELCGKITATVYIEPLIPRILRFRQIIFPLPEYRMVWKQRLLPRQRNTILPYPVDQECQHTARQQCDRSPGSEPVDGRQRSGRVDTRELYDSCNI